jgi:hypothetical protein
VQVCRHCATIVVWSSVEVANAKAAPVADAIRDDDAGADDDAIVPPLPSPTSGSKRGGDARSSPSDAEFADGSTAPKRARSATHSLAALEHCIDTLGL